MLLNFCFSPVNLPYISLRISQRTQKEQFLSSFTAFKLFLLSLVFKSLIMIYLDMNFFGFILLRFPQLLDLQVCVCVCVCVCVYVYVCVFSCVQFFATPWTVAHQAPLQWGFPGKNPGVDSHFLLQRIFPSQGSNSCLFCLLHWQMDSYQLHHLGLYLLPNV